MDCLSAGSIPVIASDLYVLPYSEVIDWKRVVIRIYEDDLARVMDIVNNVSEERVVDMRRSVQFIYEKYFSSMEKITITTLSIINERIFPSQRLSYSEWNDPPQTALVRKSFVLPMGPPRSQGFTAVVLTYDRMESLFRVLERLSKAPSLAKMVVVWNNQQKDPPPISDWPRLPKPLQVYDLFISITHSLFLLGILQDWLLILFVQNSSTDRAHQAQSAEQPFLPISWNRDRCYSCHGRRHCHVDYRRVGIRIRSVAPVPRSHRWLSIPNARLGQRQQPLEVRIGVDQQHIDGADRSRFLPPLLQLRLLNVDAGRHQNVGGRPHELRGHRHELPGGQHHRQSAH